MDAIRFLCVTIGLSLSCLMASCGSEEVYETQPFSLMELDVSPNLDSEYMAVIGDIQEYTGNADLMPYYAATLEWIYSQKLQGMNIQSVLMTGDVTSNNLPAQYEMFYETTLPLAEIVPYIAFLVKHDYKWNEECEIENRQQTPFSKYTSFKLTDSLVVERFEKHRMENVIVKNYIWGKPYYILSLEFGPRQEVLAWANAYVENHPELNFILLTHEYLSRDGERIARNSYAERQFRNTTCSSPEHLWQNLIRAYDNISWVICGHNGFHAQMFSENDKGRLVPQVLFNLQYQKNGGNGLLQLWEFPQKSDSAIVRIYNTIERCWWMENAQTVEFKFKYRY